MTIEQSSIEALSNTYGKISKRKPIYKRKGENKKITCQVKTEVNIEKTNQGSKEFVKRNVESPETLLKSVKTKFIGQGGKIRKLHQGCNRFWMHYEHEVKSCTICTDAFIEKWEIVVDIKFENAVSQKSKLNTFCCMLKFDRNFISLWGRKQTSDMDHNKKMNKLKLSQASSAIEEA